jgi:GH25 family lysozyme M1 (1,4-beta-N-acetylmuramidase)
MGIWGQDWASYQSSTPDTAGLSFAFVKITEGESYVNPKWAAQRDHAKANGLVWGGYHYPHMANEVQSEADYFLDQATWKPGDIVVLDWEGYDSANQNVPKPKQLAYKDSWLRYVKSKLPHNPVGLCCNTEYWLNVDTSSYYQDFLWIATAGRAAGNPGIKAPWLFHQYSSSPVDKDYCHLPSTAALRSWTLSFQPTPPEGDLPTPLDVWAYKHGGVGEDAWAQLNDIHKAVVSASIPSLVDGTDRSLGQHASATNKAAFDARSEIAAVKAELDQIKSTLAAIARKIGA